MPTHPTRRAVLATSTAVAFTIVQPCQVCGAQANSKVALGVVGLGGRGAWITDLFAKHGGYHISAVCDYFPEVALASGKRFGVEPTRCFSGLKGYQRMLDAKIDAIALETPPWFFPQHALASAQAGVHVYMAKPVACDVPGCTTIAEAAKLCAEKKRNFLVDFQCRTDPWIIDVVQRIHAGALGPVAMISSVYCDEGFGDPPKTRNVESRLRHLNWVNDDDLGGGYLVNAGIHAVDMMLWVANSPLVSATGMGRTGRKDPHGDSQDCYSVSYKFESGLIANHRGEHIGNLHGFQCALEVYGQGAYAETSYEGRTWLRGGEKQFKGGDVKGLYEAGAVRNIAAFHKNVIGGAVDHSTVKPSLDATLATILGREACRRSGTLTMAELMKENKRLTIPLEGMME